MRKTIEKNDWKKKQKKKNAFERKKPAEKEKPSWKILEKSTEKENPTEKKKLLQTIYWKEKKPAEKKNN